MIIFSWNEWCGLWRGIKNCEKNSPEWYQSKHKGLKKYTNLVSNENSTTWTQKWYKSLTQKKMNIQNITIHQFIVYNRKLLTGVTPNRQKLFIFACFFQNNYILYETKNSIYIFPGPIKRLKLQRSEKNYNQHLKIHTGLTPNAFFFFFRWFFFHETNIHFQLLKSDISHYRKKYNI